MKKVLLLGTMLMLTLTSFAGSGTSWKDAVDFDWENGNEQAANTTIWYKIDLSSVLSDENILLYVNNISTTVANIVAEPFSNNGGSVSSLNEETVKAIQPERNYAYELSGSLFRNLNISEVYVRMKTDKKIRIAAEPVLPGIKDLACLNAADVNYAGTHVAKGETWYRLKMAEVIAQTGKTLQVTVHNKGTATAHITGGLSLDCPSTGLTNRTITVAAGADYVYTVRRSNLDMLATDEAYILTDTDQPLLITVQIVDASPEAPAIDVTGEIDFLKDTPYTLAAATPQWYHITTADWNQRRMLPEFTVFNHGTGVATVSVQLVYAKTTSTGLERQFTLGAGEIRVEDIQKAYVQNVAGKTADAYIQITSNQPIEFSARLKEMVEGVVCSGAREFDWEGTVQTTAATTWYKIGIKEAKEKTNKDIEISLYNQAATPAKVTAQLAFECPTASTTDMTRTIAAKSTAKKVLKHSLYADLINDTVWIGVTTDQQLLISARYIDAEEFTPINICNEPSVVLFDVNGDGVSQEGGTSVWYKVFINDMLNDENKVPEITVKNRGTAVADINAELAFTCDIRSAMQSRTIQLPVNGSYVQTPTQSMLNSINPDVDYAYIRVTTNQPISIQTQMKFENEGASCQTPIAFNWTLGNDQAADTELWYAVDITEAKAAAGKSVRLQLTNKEASAALVTADIAFDCPATGFTTYNYSLAGNRTVTKDLTHAVVVSVKNDIVYIRVKTDKAIHLAASLVDEEAVFDDQCLSAIDFDWVNGHTQAAAEQWYKVDLATLRNTELVPELTLTNTGATTAHIQAKLTFVCPTTMTTTKQITLEAGATLVRTLEKNFIDAIDTQFDYAYVKVLTDQPLQFSVTLVDPNQGQDCLHPVDFDYETGHLQNAGQDVWYKIDLAVIKNTPRRALKLGIINKDGILGEATAEFYFSCEEAPFESYTQNIGADARYEKQLGRALITSVEPDYMYVHLYTAQQDSVYAQFYEEEVVYIETCRDAKKMLYNTIIPQTAGDTWYIVNLKDLRDNTTGDAELTIWNSSVDNTLTAEVAFECPVTEKMQDRTITLAPDQVYNRTIARSYLSNTAAEFAYVHIIAQEATSFLVRINDPRGKICGGGIDFDWVNGNIHPADSTLWYTVQLKDSLEKYPDKDLKLIVENLTANEVNAKVNVKGDCAEEPILKDYEKTLAAGATADKVISNAMLKGYELLHVQLYTDQNVRLTLELVDQVINRFDTTIVVYGEVCVGDSYTRQIADSTINHLIEDGKPETWTWTETIRFTYEETLYADSVVTFEVHPIQTPGYFFGKEDFTDPTVVAGQAIYVTASTADILAKYEAARNAVDEKYRDTIAQVVAVDWEILNEHGRFVALDGTKVPFTKPEVGLRYYITTECGSEVNYPETLWYDILRTNETKEIVNDTVCKGSDFTTASNKSYTITENITIPDTVYDVTPEVTKATVYTYNIKVWNELVLPELTALPTAQEGVAVDVAAADAELKAALKAQKTDPLLVAYTTIEWQIKNGDNYEPLTDALIEKGVTTVVLRYAITTECGVVYSDDITVNVTDILTITKDIAETVCVGTEYTSRLATTTITADTEWSETVNFDYSATQKADSVYHYTIKVWRELTLPTITALPTAQVGTPVDVAAADAELKAALEAQKTAEPLLVPYTTIEWQIKNGDNYETLTNALVEQGTTTIVLRYAITTECGIVYGADITITVGGILTYEKTEVDTVCVGTEYVSRTKTTTITADAEWDETVTFDLSDTQKADSIYHYSIKVYQPITLPATIGEIAPLAVCGYKFDAQEATTQLLALLSDLVQPINSTVEAIKWEAEVNGTYTDLTTLPVLSAAIDEYNIRYVVTTSCGEILVSEPFAVAVEMPDPANTPELANLPAVSKYNDYLLMIHLNKFKEMGYEPAEDQVRWYKVTGNPDYESAETDDEQVGTGYYYTTGEQLVGSFYTLIDIPALETDGCDVSLRTQLLACSGSTVVSLAPSIVAPGEDVNLNGLNPELNYTLSIYDLMGVLVQRMTISGETAYTFKAQPQVGYYMLRVDGDQQTTTLKYIVK